MPVQYTAATADLGILEGRLTAARAAALDELLAANIPTDLINIAGQNTNLQIDATAILADVGGLAGAAMRGTDGVDVAAMRGTDGAALATQFDNGYTEEEIANGASLLPDDGLIITGITCDQATCTLCADDAFSDTEVVVDTAEGTAISIAADDVEMVFMACDGARVVIDNLQAGNNWIGVYWFRVK